MSVVVKEGLVVVVVMGGESQFVRVGDSLLLDAFESYDADVDPQHRWLAKDLKFEWACSEVMMEVNTSASITKNGHQNSNSIRNSNCSVWNAVNSSLAKIELRSRVGYVQNEAQSMLTQWTVNVSDSSGTRMVSKSVLVTLVSALSSTVRLTPNMQLSRTKYNLEEVVLLTALVSTPVDVSVNISWSQDVWSKGFVSLASVASTPLVHTVRAVPESKSGSMPDYQSAQVQLKIPSQSLSSMAGLSMRLYCMVQPLASTNLMVTTAMMTLWVNSGPSLGVLRVYPSNGTELSTLFELSGSQWVDEDLPLSYSFGLERILIRRHWCRCGASEGLCRHFCRVAVSRGR